VIAACLRSEKVRWRIQSSHTRRLDPHQKWYDHLTREVVIAGNMWMRAILAVSCWPLRLGGL